MRAKKEVLLLATTFIVLHIGFVRCEPAAVPAAIQAGEPSDCSCEYHRGGCVISEAAPVGFKCKCRYRGAWTCSGDAYPCTGQERCPGHLADYCACKLGDGDCGGYKNPITACENSGYPRLGVEGKAECDCDYKTGGCNISKPAPYGWKCVCTYKGFWSCDGWAQQCAASEVCLGEDSSYCGCHQGGGDCGGYVDKPTCHAVNLSTSCNCNKASDWNKGLYSIENVKYESKNAKIQQLQPITLTEKDVPNPSSEVQTTKLNISGKLTSSSSFSRTGGIEIEAGTKFRVGIPSIHERSIAVTKSFPHTYGQPDSLETSYDGSFTCSGVPHKRTRCTVTMQKAQITVPYSLTVKHKIIPNCACESQGSWTGTQTYNPKATSKVVGNCNQRDCQ